MRRVLLLRREAKVDIARFYNEFMARDESRAGAFLETVEDGLRRIESNPFA